VLERVAASDRERFGVVHWGRAPLLSHAADLSARAQVSECAADLSARAQVSFADLFSSDAVDELLSRRGLRTPFLRMAKDGSVLPPARFTRGGGAGASAADQVADDKVLAQLAEGATLVLQGLHRTWPPLIDFGNELSADLGHPVQINAYITPPQSRGFAAHYDVHDVFVLQISGTKQWRVHEPVLIDPLPGQEWESRRAEVEARATQAPIIDAVLAPGDVLYLPRGFLHSATAQGDFSIHLTVGVHPITRARLVRELMVAARADAELRRSLPMGVDLGDPAVLAPSLGATVAALHRHLDTVQPATIAAAVGTELRAQTRPEPIAPLATLTAAAALRPSSSLRLRRGLRSEILVEAEAIAVALIDTTVRFPLAAGPALKFVLDGSDFTPADLPGLDGPEQLTLSRRLLREGIVVGSTPSA
jgi:lysine-specific demethylase/histidyl-hydroxylase NO66